MRGMAGSEAAIISGMAHMTSFVGSETIPAIAALEEYYEAAQRLCSKMASLKRSTLLKKLDSGLMKGFMESFNHPFGKEACKKRLLEEYKKYGELIVAFDYDNTIFDYHNNGGDYSCVIELLKRCARLGFETGIIYL